MIEYSAASRKIDDRLAEEIALIHGESFDKKWAGEEITSLFNNDNTYIITAVDAGKTIGFIIFRYLLGEAEIITVAVRPEYRKRSIASTILRGSISFLKANGGGRIHLEVAANDEAALNLYLKNGFTKTSIRKDYYTRNGIKVDAINMSLDI